MTPTMMFRDGKPWPGGSTILDTVLQIVVHTVDFGLKGHVVRPYETMGSAQSIIVEKGRAYGAGDPRRPGALASAP